jgi:deoxyribonuclease (pyrimidine dimer)
LCDAHLIKERIELLRIPNAIKTGKAVVKDIPKYFTLGKGHVKFFYDKIGYLHKRYSELTAECHLRGFNITDFSDSFDGISMSLWNDYNETKQDRTIVVDRVNERLSGMKNLKYNRKPIDLDQLLIKTNDIIHTNNNRLCVHIR